jgi:Holliday junction DNA helicase RuvA
MIVRASGKLEFVGDESVHVTVGDFTYELFVPAADVPHLQTKIGQAVTFFTLDYIEGNASFGQLAPRLIGFLRHDDKEFFNLFIGVKGIGPRKALRAFTIPVGQIASAIALKDTKVLKGLPGIGGRAAEQIIAELHGKVETFATGHASKAAPAVVLADYQQSAIEVLVKLGERRVEAENWVDRVCKVDPSITDPQKVIQAVYRLKAGVK